MRGGLRGALPFLLLCVLLVGLGFLWGLKWPALADRISTQRSPAGPRPVIPRGDLRPDERETVEAFQKASPSVVYITTMAVRRDFFSFDVREVPRGTGSGFLWDETGHVVTNYHVIENSDSAQVTLTDQSTWEARLVGAAPEKDLAVLRIDAPAQKLRPLPVGSSADLLAGQKVFAIGNPFGLDQTLTTGIISALGRSIETSSGIPIRDLIQTDAAINPGNSGGPLMDSSGRLIGVNTAIYSPSGASAGIGFAIPVDTVNWVVPDLIAYGRIIRPTLGVYTATDQTMRRFGLEGVLILDLVPGGGAQRAGLNPTRRDRSGQIVLGDIIVAVGGDPVRTSNDLLLVLEKRKPGETVPVTVLRDGKKVQVPVVLQEAR